VIISRSLSRRTARLPGDMAAQDSVLRSVKNS
jgi:hypothetical protein